MSDQSSADHGSNPPQIGFPRMYNAAHDLIERNLRAGRGSRTAYIDDAGRYSFGELARRVNRFASGLRALGIRPEDRIMICQLDTIDWPVAFLGAIKAGVVPVAVNTNLRAADYEYMLADSRARLLFTSPALLQVFEGIDQRTATLDQVIVTGAQGPGSFAGVLDAGRDQFEPAATVADETAFWLYSSGSTGPPKGTLHRHSSLLQTYELYAKPTLALSDSDIVFSAAKLFFAYGLGNALTFPLAAGATTVLMAERPTAEAVFARWQQHRPTVFFGVPTLFAAMLSHPGFPTGDALRLRVCVSAGEALPAEIGRRFAERCGAPLLDGIGSTEMLHIFLTNRVDKLRYGSSGQPLDGYRLRIVDDAGQDCPDGQIGDLLINGPSSASQYWNNRARSCTTFLGEWTRSGDKYFRDSDGFYIYAGRSDDMLKVSGQYVSPFEVEQALATHPAVLEAAVVGHADDDGLIKPKAFVVLKPEHTASAELAVQIQRHVKERLAPFKYPRWIDFADDLPKTATGKIQRFKLR